MSVFTAMAGVPILHLWARLCVYSHSNLPDAAHAHNSKGAGYRSVEEMSLVGGAGDTAATTGTLYSTRVCMPEGDYTAKSI